MSYPRQVTALAYVTLLSLILRFLSVMAALAAASDFLIGSGAGATGSQAVEATWPTTLLIFFVLVALNEAVETKRRRMR